MAKDGLSAREAALIAEARAALARKAAQGASPTAPQPISPPQSQPSAPPLAAAGPQTEPFRAAKPDPAVIAARIAAMMEAEREQTLRRKQKMKQTGTAIVVIAFVPVILWAAAKLLAQLMR